MNEGLLPKTRLCPRPSCHKENVLDQQMRLWDNTKPDGCNWYCRRINKKNKRMCPAAFSVRTGTVFARSRLTLSEMVFTIFLNYFLKINSFGFELLLIQLLFTILRLRSCTSGWRTLSLSTKLDRSYVLKTARHLSNGTGNVARFRSKSALDYLSPSAARASSSKSMNRSLGNVSQFFLYIKIIIFQCS